MKIIAFVPAKGNSSRIKNKNLSILDGDFLFRSALSKLKQSKIINEVVLDTDCEKIINYTSHMNISVLKRSADLANNDTDGHQLFRNEVESRNADIYIQLLCTAPFLSIKTIDTALKKFICSTKTSLVFVTKEKQYLWSDNNPTYGYSKIPNSNDLPDTIKESMCFYAVKKKDGKITKRFDKNVMLFEINQKEAFDVNTPEDLEYARIISDGIKSQKNKQLNFLKKYLSSSIFYDVMTNMNLECILPQNIKPIVKGKLFGYAKTLSLSPINKSIKNDWKDIYKALDSYKFIQENDIIIVSNSVNNRAYFGELNCNLAIRSGASGFIIDGFVRDLDAILDLNFPVYCKGSYAKDIRFYGKMETVNQPIKIGNIVICNNDYIFADNDGCIVIPNNIFEDVLSEALKIVANEQNIIHSIINNNDVSNILKDFGEF